MIKEEKLAGNLLKLEFANCGMVHEFGAEVNGNLTANVRACKPSIRAVRPGCPHSADGMRDTGLKLMSNAITRLVQRGSISDQDGLNLKNRLKEIRAEQIRLDNEVARKIGPLPIDARTPFSAMQDRIKDNPVIRSLIWEFGTNLEALKGIRGYILEKMAEKPPSAQDSGLS